MKYRALGSSIAVLVAACGGGRLPPPATGPVPAPVAPPPPAAVAEPAPRAVEAAKPLVAPRFAMLAGLMPLRSTGVEAFRRSYPNYDGRGVLIGILDSGIDPGLLGFQHTTLGDRKIVDLRDFSGEGHITLAPITPSETGTVMVGGRQVFGIATLASRVVPPYYGGVFRELPLGPLPASDVNGNGTNTDVFPVVVARASDGWVMVTDTDGNGSLVDEKPVHDFAVAGETFWYRRSALAKGPARLTIAANLAEADGKPVLSFYFDNSGHGSHVAGIAAGHRMFDVEGFDGVAPGAELLGLKIANDARGGISVTGSMVRAMEYAVDVARQRAQPLVLNLSFGIGNAVEGTAAIDSLVDAFLLNHPQVLFVISAGNDGPGISTIGFPGSAGLALTACALLPGVFAQVPKEGAPPVPDVLGGWSARGGEVAKPDVCTPGVAFSNVPLWHTGEEISGGTSMAAPHAAGMGALLASALVQNNRSVRAVDLKRALMVSALPVGKAPSIEEGSGVPNATEAYRWLLAAHQTGLYHVQSLPDGGNSSRSSGAYRRTGLASASDTMQQFVVTPIGGQSAARLLLSSDAAWLRSPSSVELRGGPVTIGLSYDPSLLEEPGLYVGTIRAYSASDTLAGPVLQLSNTIIVPRKVDQRFQARETLPAGRAARYFFDVPASAGGFRVTLELRGANQQASLYLFEPDGAPFRGGNAPTASPDSQEVSIGVAAEDIVPGVYEVVVLSPPTQPVTYRIEAGVPVLAVERVGTGLEAVVANHSTDTVRTTLSSRLVGATRTFRLERSDGHAHLIRATAASWASKMVIDVAVPAETWVRLTDFGLTVFDSAGQQISQSPMNNGFVRKVVDLDSVPPGTPLTIELLPAFARDSGAFGWNANVKVNLIAERPVQLKATTVGTSEAPAMAPGATETLQLGPLPAVFNDLEGFAPLVEVEASTGSGPPSVRRGGI